MKKTTNPISRFFCLLFFCPTILFIFQSCLKPKTEEKLIDNAPVFLDHKGIKIGILPSTGGTLVYLSTENKSNILKSDSTLWYSKNSQFVPLSADYKFPNLNGHTVWVGPQSQWWTQQNTDPSARRNGQVWPPDPYISFGRYSILNISDSSILIESPDSPYSRIRLQKEIIIIDSGKIKFRAVITNISDSPVSWDIWMNTRLEGTNPVYVPVSGIENIQRVKSEITESEGTFYYELKNGFFSFRTASGPGKKLKYSAKAFLYPDSPFVAVFCGNSVFIKEFPYYDKARIHPEQALVEIFLFKSNDPKESLLEVEHHSPYKTIQPGESMEDYEIWHVLPYGGENTKEGHLDFLNKSFPMDKGPREDLNQE